MDVITHQRRAKIIFFIVFLFSCLGFYALIDTADQLEPDTANDSIAIQLALPGVSAEKMEQDILISLETELAQLDGVKSVKCISADGIGRLYLELQAGRKRDLIWLQECRTVLQLWKRRVTATVPLLAGPYLDLNPNAAYDLLVVTEKDDNNLKKSMQNLPQAQKIKQFGRATNN